jgi:hypothetical protein
MSCVDHGVWYHTIRFCPHVQLYIVFMPLKIKKGKAIPVTGCGGPQGCVMLSLSHFLDNWLTDGSEVVSLMHQPPFTTRKVLNSVRD